MKIDLADFPLLMGKPQIALMRPLSLLTAKALRIYQYQWKFLGLAGLKSHPLRHNLLMNENKGLATEL
jgi:hypothetical protein